MGPEPGAGRLLRWFVGRGGRLRGAAGDRHRHRWLDPAAGRGDRDVGHKPTYGAVSRYGLIAFSSSLDQAGPFGRTVLDAALLHEVIAGHDPADSTSIPQPVPTWSPPRGPARRDLAGCRSPSSPS